MDADDTIRPKLFCKIQRSGNTIFVGANLAAVFDVKYDAYEIFSQVAKKKGSFAKAVNMLEKEITPALTNALNFTRRNDSQGYARNYNKKNAFMFFLGAIEQGNLKLAVRNFKAVASTNEIKIHIERSDYSNKSRSAIRVSYIGRADAIETFLAADSARLSKLSPVEIAQFLVNLEISDDHHVGPPIDIVRLDKAGLNWVKRKPECEE